MSVHTNDPLPVSQPDLAKVAREWIQAGRFTEARTLLEAVSATDPHYAQALHMLGSLAYQRAEHEASCNWLRQAIALNPDMAEAHRDLGRALYALGRHEDATAALRQASILKPDSVEALLEWGDLLAERGRHKDARECYRRALSRRPALIDSSFHDAEVAEKRGDLLATEIRLRRVLALKPDHHAALTKLGFVARAKGRASEAATCFREALRINPRHAPAHNGLGVVLMDRKQHVEAVTCFYRALEHDSRLAEAHVNLGLAFWHRGLSAQARQYLGRAIDLGVQDASACNALAMVLKDLDRPDEAIALLHGVLGRDPASTQALTKIGLIFHDTGQFEEAAGWHRRALEVDPDCAEACVNLGASLTALRQTDEAVACLRRAVSLAPAMPAARLGLAMTLLLRGEYEEGWQEYEWRMQAIPFLQAEAQKLDRPRWDGQNLEGRTILLYGEQGLGDQLQFVRYAPWVKRRGGRVLLYCPGSLKRLFETLEGVDRVVAHGDALPAYDVQCPLMSLPALFGTTVESVPNDVPYLRAPQELMEQWRTRIGGDQRLKVGLVWSGTPGQGIQATRTMNMRRSMRLADLAPLARIPGIQLFSLQLGEARDQLRQMSATMQLTDVSGTIEDFADTAGAVSNLDLIISVDTSVVHLAGSMGKPVWLLSRFDGCWRWLLDREDSPWYPSLKVFRQDRPGDWAAVVAGVSTELHALANRRDPAGAHRAIGEPSYKVQHHSDPP